mgnify:FL=1
MEKIKKIVKKILNKDVMLYIFFGVLTTIVNFVAFYLLNVVMNIDGNISNLVAIPLAIIFAYFTNRKWVFHTEAKGFKENFNEFCKFVAGRAVTMFIEFFGCMLLFKTPIPEIVSKLGVNVIIIFLNFFISKFFAFKKKDNK